MAGFPARTSMQQRERSLLVVSAVSTLTALSLALYILWNSGSSDDQDQKRADISPEIVPDEPRKVKDKKHPLERKDIFYDSCVYMDYNATTPVYTEVYESMEPFFTIHFGNPSSSHLFGPDAKRAIDLARLQVAKMISCTSPSEEIVFTSCGTESDNSAIDIAIFQYLKRRQLTPRTCPIEQLPEIITTAIEHPAVLCYLRNLKLDGSIKLVILSVNSEGFVSLNELERVLTVNTALVSIMHSNNEVGTLQPIRAISHTISAFNRRNKTKVLFHSDAAQSVGKIPIDVNFLGVDMLTIVGHKYGAPKGIAVLYVKRSSVAHVPPLLVGGGQEKGRRAGTENVPYIVGLGTASSYASTHLLENILHLLTLKLQLLSLLQTTLQQEGYLHLVKFNGPKRSVHYQQLQEDMKVLRLLFHSHDQSQNNKSLSTPTANAEENSPLTPLSPQGDLSPASAQHYQQYQQFQQQQQSRTRLPENTAADVLEQLPNTISVSFRGLIGHEIVSELGNKVRYLLYSSIVVL